MSEKEIAVSQLQALADHAARTARMVDNLPPDQRAAFGAALLDTSLEIQRRYLGRRQ